MSYLVDTNVISELRRREPDPNVVEWFGQRPSIALFLSILTLGEIRKSIELVPDGKRKLRLLARISHQADPDSKPMPT